MNKKIVGLSLALILLGASASFAPAVGAEGGAPQSATGSGLKLDLTIDTDKPLPSDVLESAAAGQASS